MAPLFNTVVRIDAHRPQWDPVDTALRNFGALAGATRPHYCPSCITEDFKRLGFSYWHRVHHLPGIAICTTHHVPLRRTNSLIAFQSCPGGPSDDGCDSSATAPIHPITGRYAAILENFLAQPRRLKLRDVRTRVLEHQVLHGAYCDHGHALAATPALPPPWDFIRLGDIRAHEAISVDRNTLVTFKQASAFNATTYAMALAIIFPAASSAISFHTLDTSAPAQRHFDGQIDQAFWNEFDESANDSGLTLHERYACALSGRHDDVNSRFLNGTKPPLSQHGRLSRTVVAMTGDSRGRR